MIICNGERNVKEEKVLLRNELTNVETLIMKCIWDTPEELALSELVAMVNERFGKSIPVSSGSDRGDLSGCTDCGTGSLLGNKRNTDGFFDLIF